MATIASRNNRIHAYPNDDDLNDQEKAAASRRDFLDLAAYYAVP